MICFSLHPGPLTYNTIYAIITHLQTLTIQKKKQLHPNTPLLNFLSLNPRLRSHTRNIHLQRIDLKKHTHHIPNLMHRPPKKKL
jgi:hypothetical protein